MSAPPRLETDRLILRKPSADDAEAIFGRYASNPEVTRYVGWPRHERIEDTRAFLEFSDAQWERWPAGPYLIELAEDASLIGSTGLAFETPQRASTGYVLARDAWGQGYATEALRAMVGLAADLEIYRLFAVCHPDHRASAHVLEKCGFRLEATLCGQTVFPNLSPGKKIDALCYALMRPGQ